MNRASRRAASTTKQSKINSKDFRMCDGIPTKIKRFSKEFEAGVNEHAKDFSKNNLSSPFEKLEFEEWISENFTVVMGYVNKETREHLETFFLFDNFSETDSSLIDDSIGIEILFKANTERAISDFGDELVPFNYLIYRFYMG